MTSKGRYLAIGLLAIGAIVILGKLVWGDPRLALHGRQPFSRESYLAYAQPWGGDQSGSMKWWGTYADTIRVDPQRFPDNSGISWRWPYWAPANNVSVWAYNHLTYGTYDGGDPEIRIAPRRVDDIKVLRQAFAWTRSAPFGEANLLTEFYLLADPAKPDVKQLEIGWFLHTPATTGTFVRGGKPIGVYADAAGRRWAVTMNERFCTFTPVDGGDVTTGTIDMLAALRWLQRRGVITGREWFTGVAIGAEALTGFGTMQIDRWAVTYR